MITIFGSINLDLIAQVARLPGPGETVPGNSFDLSPGGKGANQALAVARAGAAARLVGAVGRDEFAEPALALLRSGGVDLALVRAVEGATGVALILVDQAGENMIAVIPGANGLVGESAARALDFEAGDVLLLQLEIPVPSISLAARRAREIGALVLLNFAPFRADALGLLDQVSHLIVNESECALVAEALQISGQSLAAQAAELAQRFAIAVIVTLGKDGALAVAGGKIETVSALPVEALDAVGAGDTFCGYLAVGLAQGASLVDALRFAAAAGSLACTTPGAQPSIPTRGEVDSARPGGLFSP